MTRVLVTGATGFVGNTLCEVIARSGYEVRAAVRASSAVVPGAASHVLTGDLAENLSWRTALEGVDSVIHLAARAHVLNAPIGDADLYRHINACGTLNLARQAAEAGVRRFVLLSSIKVNGEAVDDRPFSASDPPRPADPYGESKWQAEQYAQSLGGAMEVVVVRPPLIYGPGVKANFLRLMQWVDRERPLPLGSVANRRSLVSVWNLCDLLRLTLSSPVAPGRAWMVCDRECLSTPELVRRIGAAMHRRVRLWPVPVRMLSALGGLLGRREEVSRLCSSLTVDMQDTCELLGWSPPLGLDEALRRTVGWYLSGARSHAG